MSDPQPDQFEPSNEQLRETLAQLQENLDHEVEAAGLARRQLGALRVIADSPNGLATITVDSAGVLLGLTIADDAFRRCTPRQLAAEITATVEAAVEGAAEKRAEFLAPTRASMASVPDFSDIVPGTPSLRAVRDDLSRAANPDTEAGHQRG